MERTQYYQAIMSATKDGKTSKTDITKELIGNITYTDVDGSVRGLSVALRNGFLWMDIVGVGNRIDLIAGTVDDARLIFTGFVKLIQPEFGDETTLRLTCYAQEWQGLALEDKDLFYPSPNHPKVWGQNEELAASDIIKSLAIDVGLRIGRLQIKNDVVYSYKAQIRQHKESDWAFLQRLATKINSVAWVEIDGEDPIFNLIAEETIVNTLGNVTFFYPARRDGLQTINKVSDTMIQIFDLSLSLDTTSGSAGSKLTVKGDKVVKEVLDKKTGSWENWVFDEEKLKNESEEKHDELLAMYDSGNLVWEEVKKYFRKATMGEIPSRDPIPENLTVINISGDPQANGVNSTEEEIAERATAENKSYRLNDGKIAALSPEERSGLLGRTSRGELSDEEFDKFFDPYEPAKKKKAEETRSVPQPTTQEAGKTRRASNGFNMTFTCYGNLDIKTKVSYVIEGLGKFSGKYYLYQVQHVFGTQGFLTKLKFVK